MKLFVILVLSIQMAFASNTAIESDQWEKTFELVQQKVKKYGAKNVLLVSDIDNTILTMPQDLGSDQWFNWQYETCVKAQVEAKNGCITSNMDTLIEIQGQLFAISNMVPTERNTAEIIKKIQNMGVKSILLTSRGVEFRFFTERVLKQNDMWFGDSSIGPKEGFAAPYLPYDLNKYKASGLTEYDVKEAKLGDARPVSFHNGIYMTAGQHKGIMLKTLLHKTGAKYKSIIFVDDHARHTTNMHAIFEPTGVDMATVRYSRVDENVNKFNLSDKKHVIRAWNTLKDATTEVFR